MYRSQANVVAFLFGLVDCSSSISGSPLQLKPAGHVHLEDFKDQGLAADTRRLLQAVVQSAAFPGWFYSLILDFFLIYRLIVGFGGVSYISSLT